MAEIVFKQIVVTLDTQGLLFSFPRHGNQPRVWEMKEDERTKSLSKNQLCAIF